MDNTEAILSVAEAINRLADAVTAMSPNGAPKAVPAKKRTEALVAISEELAKFIGVSPTEHITRKEATSLVMKYVKNNNLQTEDDRRKIAPDSALEKLVSSKEIINVLNLRSSLQSHFTVVE